ncbi:hypothetical protein RQP46_000202 [Phenoliferia psychrophenolica]
MEILDGTLATATTGDEVRRALASAVGGVQDPEELAEVVALVLMTLDLRATESLKPLDPGARSLRNTLHLFSSHLLDSPPPSTPPPPPPSSKSKRRAKRTPSPTLEQLALIHSPTEPGITIVNSYAGTGKTTALVQMAEEICRKNPKARILYLSFNRSVEKAAFKAFRHLEKNVTSQTVNSKAYRYLCGKHTDEVINAKVFETMVDESGEKPETTRPGKEIRPLDAEEVVEALDLKPGRYTTPERPHSPPKPLDALVIGKRVVISHNKFASSTSPTLSVEHLHKSPSYRPSIPPAELLRLTSKLWDMASDLANVEVPLPFGMHVKLCLQDPTFEMEKYDVIMFDEVQDSSDVDLEMIVRAAQHSRIVLNGDKYQAIYHRNCPELTHNTQNLPQANAANSILALRDETIPLTATSSPGLLFRPDAQDISITGSVGRTIIFRTNNGIDRILLRHAGSLDLSSPDPLPRLDVRMAPSRLARLFPLYHHAHRLACDLPEPHPDGRRSRRLEAYSSWEELVAGVSELKKLAGDMSSEDRELVLLMDESAELLKEDFAERWDRVFGSIVKEGKPSDVLLGTVHQVKGLEFERVVLANDFSDHLAVRRATGFSIEEEANLLYVALTRATREVTLNDSAYRVLLANEGLHQTFAQFWGDLNPSKIAAEDGALAKAVDAVCATRPATPGPAFSSVRKATENPKVRERAIEEEMKPVGNFWVE